MARYNEIQHGWINKFLYKVTGIKGESPAPQLAGEIQPVIQIATGAEMRALQGWRRYGKQLDVTGGAGQAPAVRLRNPPGSNVIAVIEFCKFHCGVTANIIFDLAPIGGGVSDLTTIVTPISIDGRQLTTAGNCVLSTDTNGGSLGASAQLAQLTYVTTADDGSLIDNPNQEIPMLPASTFQVVGIANLTMKVSLQWRERFLEEPERTA